MYIIFIESVHKMRILLLYNNDIALELAAMLRNIGNSVEVLNKNVDKSIFEFKKFDLIVSYTYRYIIKLDIIELYKNRIVNIHNSYLPFNKGTSPNLWSIIDNTPKGVTIHFVNDKIDDGDIITQQLVEFDYNDTLCSSYFKLDYVAKKLLIQIIPYFNKWKDMSKRSNYKGTYHNNKQSLVLLEIIKYNYNLKIKEFLHILNSKTIYHREVE